METQQIDLDKDAAKALYQQYREHQHYAEPIDREIQKAYRLISQGRVIIRALESIRVAGVGPDGMPKLAIGRADKPICYGRFDGDGAATFDGIERWSSRSNSSTRFVFPIDTFPRGKWQRAQALAPLIPIHLRPKQALDAYHILWEAEWRPMPPRDPMLLRRIGHADLWLVVAAWDLTDVEFAALSTRVTAQ